LIGGLVLAAGAGVRFGEGSGASKLLAELNGRPLLEYAIRAQCEVSEIDRVVVVLGSRASSIVSAVSFGRAEPIVCPDWERGQSASLRFGLAALSGVDRVIVTLGDEPLITSSVVAMFVGQPPGTRAVYDGRPGHPVVLGAEQIRALSSVRGDQGARSVLRGGRVIECAGMCSGRDVDTPSDLEAIRHEARAVV
jgi:molybdenum cofactor cytidylyltransferase